MVRVALLVFRVVAAFMSATAIAVMLAAVAVWPVASQARRPVLVLLVRPAFEIAVTFLLGVVTMTKLLPERSTIVDEPDHAPLSSPANVLLMALGLVATLLTPLLWTVAQEGWHDVAALTAIGADPLGFRLIPAALMCAAFVLAVLDLATCLATSMLGVLVPRAVSARVIAGGAALQGGLVAGGYLLREHVARAWFTPRQMTTAALEVPLALLALGYVVAVGLGYGARTRPIVTRRRAARRQVSRPPRVALFPPAASLRPGARAGVVSTFQGSSYAVRPRLTRLALLTAQRATEYDIESVPARVDERYRLSWRDGTVVRVGTGMTVLSITPAEPPGRGSPIEYVVRDPATSGVVGCLVRRGERWDVLDRSRALLGQLRSVHFAHSVEGYAVVAANVDACRLSWAMPATAATSPGLDIEILPAADPRLGPLVVVLATIIEQHRLSRRFQSA